MELQAESFLLSFLAKFPGLLHNTNGVARTYESICYTKPKYSIFQVRKVPHLKILEACDGKLNTLNVTSHCYPEDSN